MSDLMLLKSYRNAYEARDWMGCDLIAKKVKPLTDKINKLRNELDEIKSGSTYFNGVAQAEIGKLKAENEKLRKAVEFYADKDLWIYAYDPHTDRETSGICYEDNKLHPSEDGGELARATLKEVDGE